jgi:mannosyltransferase
MNFQKHKDTLIFLSILLLAFLLRLFFLAHESIWLDEGISIAMAKLNFAQLIDKSAVDSFPPLYYLLLHYWMLLFGDSEFAVRFLSLVFSLASIVMSYQLTKYFFQEKVAMITAFLLAISVFHIEYAQETRMYSLLTFLSVSSCYFFLQWKDTGAKKWMLLLFFVNLLFLYVHILAVFFIVAENIYYFVVKKKGAITFKSWMALQFILLLSFLPWMQMFYTQAAEWHKTTWMPKPTLRDMVGTFSTYSGSILLTLIFGVLIIKALIGYRKEEHKFNFLVWWFTFPTLILLAFCFLFGSIYLQKYTIASSIPFFILVAYGIQSFEQKKHKIWLLSAISVLAAIKLAVYYAQEDKEQWRDAVALVEKKAKKEDVILFDAAYCKHNAFDYYAKRSDLNKLPLVDVREELNESNVSRLDSLSMKANSTWLVLSHSRDKKALLQNKIKVDYEVLLHQKLIGIELYQLRRRVSRVF